MKICRGGDDETNFPEMETSCVACSLQIRNISAVGTREKIIEFARRKGMDYKALAAASGLPRPTVHRYLAGKNDLTGARIDKLLDVLGLAVGRKTRTKEEIHPPPALFMEPIAGTRPILRYPGSKWRLMPNIIRMVAPHHHFVVLFGGSGSDILRKPPSPLETFNDLDGGIYRPFSSSRTRTGCWP